MENCPEFTSDSFLPFPNNSEIPDGDKRNFKKHDNFKQQKIKKDLMKMCLEGTDQPWKKKPQYNYGVVGLHEEIEDFFETMCPKPQETELRLKVIEHITRIVHSLWPLAQVEIFGSFRTGLYLSSRYGYFWRMEKFTSKYSWRSFRKKWNFKSDINIIAKAAVPIIRIVHSPSNIRVDISFNMSNGVESAKLIKKLIKEHPTLPKLVLVLKQYLVHRGFNEVYNGGMSSYCLTLLIVSLLQGYHKPDFIPSLNLGTILLEFFEHYGINFNYDKVSIHFQEGGLYKPRSFAPRTGNVLSVEDPLVKGHDVAKGTYLMHLLKMSFQNAFHVLSKAVIESGASKIPVNSYLHLILQVDKEVISKENQC